VAYETCQCKMHQNFDIEYVEMEILGCMHRKFFYTKLIHCLRILFQWL
jgi:hypothetical protein